MLPFVAIVEEQTGWNPIVEQEWEWRGYGWEIDRVGYESTTSGEYSEEA
jgi:hypothetical protein